MKTKLRSIMSIPRLLATAGLLMLIAFSVLQPVGAQELIQGYAADAPLQRGMIVRLNADDTTKVEPLKAQDIESMHGVVVDANDAPATLSTDTEQIFVAISGKYEVLVSDQNGEIKPGDYLSISGADGIAMKADNNATLVVGKALKGFDGKDGVLSNATAADKEVRLSRVLTDINVAANPLYRPDNDYVPPVVRDMAETISGKPVSTFKLYIALLVVLASAVLAGFILYSGIKGGMVAVGRNPLSKHTITKNIVKVTVLGILTFACGIFGVYLLLKL